MNRIGRWALIPATTAPVLLIGGWTLAAAHQRRGYDPVRDTISSLAALGARDRWIMTAALTGLGVCYAAVGAGLRTARPPGRVALVIGGLGTVGVAAFPQPVHGNSGGHTIAATVAFASLALWPCLAAGRRSDSVLLRVPVAVAATATMAALVLWFVFEVHGGYRGLAERTAAGAEALWPLAVVLSQLPASKR